MEASNHTMLCRMGTTVFSQSVFIIAQFLGSVGGSISTNFCLAQTYQSGDV